MSAAESTESTTSTAVTATKSSKVCPVCNEPGTKVCAGCGLVGYCTKEHQREHWKVHKATCAQKHKTPSQRPSEADIQVLWEDQQRINQFSRLNTKYQQLEDEIKIKKNDLANIIDAHGEVESLLDDNSCKIKIGEVYFDVENDEAETYVNKQKKTVEEQMKTLKTQQEEAKKQMDELKTVLYAKFGKAINLENSEQTINN